MSVSKTHGLTDFAVDLKIDCSTFTHSGRAKQIKTAASLMDQ
jgi:hypothetical protein